ncbi:flagellar hook-associated protein FlgK [Pectobacterium carotovorum]|uniref:flagellar hook-associated protein FlgK n=1 Tax=Pectobacterium carotovorum TaxID=554 RepID=UPI00050645FD|nr:flagellar hook-associated protein FlgK [Pectobacterium carotovorum]KAA3665880.1 flagellar hook-associated protein FlgK [Pectobacterium carotovorum subsp. carotovorum]KFX00977.1 flagellar hook protein FlgK [Pectobacterium carotovorum subsp. carotovorum]KML70544.1 flagellar hook protein FlgK [Pectobacterium carotovorum subsp. carotovorum ICMP 5702]UCZ78148.1 flagellar hook-associated protein FlgK [Pectobacterium carotovorum]SHG99954.1 flagellar hook-associated protein 1 FlgK [Pectobacterium c
MSNLINTAMSGLKGAQVALSTVSNNISNQAVTGYSRQNAILEQATSSSTSAGYIGNGVNVVSINRQYNEFITNQLRSAQTTSSSVTAYYEQISKIDNLLASSTTSLSSTIQGFFSNLQNLTSNAGDSSTRQTVLGKAEGLVNQFKVTDKYLRDMDSGLNTQIQSTVGQINTYTDQIASLNNEITKLMGANSGTMPNDLLDQRDLLVDQLNKLVGVDVTVQDGIVYNVALKNGTNLVQAGTSNQLVAISSSSDPSRLTIGYKDRTNDVVTLNESTLTGGSLGGLIAFRTETLDEARNQLGQLALAFADAFNAQHQKGFDHDGVKGGDFFSFGKAVVLNDSKNGGNAVLTPSYTDTKDVQATNYSIKYDGASWQVTRLSDNSKFTATVDTSDNSLNFDGIKMTISGTPATNDSFLLKPVNDVITDMSVAISDPNKIAAASVKLDDAGNPVVDGSGNPVFGGVGDNTNAKALLALQNEKIVGGKASASGAYASLVGMIGNQTSTLKINNTSQQNVVKQLTAEQQSVAGVNLDEEYGDLMRYQQYYMANAQVIKTAQSIFDALLAARS